VHGKRWDLIVKEMSGEHVKAEEDDDAQGDAMHVDELPSTNGDLAVVVAAATSETVAAEASGSTDLSADVVAAIALAVPPPTAAVTAALPVSPLPSHVTVSVPTPSSPLLPRTIRACRERWQKLLKNDPYLAGRVGATVPATGKGKARATSGNDEEEVGQLLRKLRGEREEREGDVDAEGEDEEEEEEEEERLRRASGECNLFLSVIYLRLTLTMMGYSLETRGSRSLLVPFPHPLLRPSSSPCPRVLLDDLDTPGRQPTHRSRAHEEPSPLVE
jgi:hypothetical protein